MLEPGYLVLERYVIERLIGAGGMGLIYRAWDSKTNEAVAVKCLRPLPDLSENDVLRFEREARLLIQLEHPHVLDVIEVGTLADGGIPALVMELLEGRDLRQEIKVRERFPVDEAVGYLLQASQAVGAVHEAGIIHRDIKPQNLFITNITGARHLKLLDFGISKADVEGEMTLTATQGTLGTPQYMSPEQILGAKKVDQRTDIWALGVMLYFLLAGRLPFTGPSPSAVIAAIPSTEPKPLTSYRNDIPPDLIEVVRACLTKDRDQRVESAQALYERLLPFGPPDGVIVAPAVDIPSTVPPIVLALRPSFGAPAQRSFPPRKGGAEVTKDLSHPASGGDTPRLLETTLTVRKPVVFPSSDQLMASVNGPLSDTVLEPPELTIPSSRRLALQRRKKRFVVAAAATFSVLAGAIYWIVDGPVSEDRLAPESEFAEGINLELRATEAEALPAPATRAETAGSETPELESEESADEETLRDPSLAKEEPSDTPPSVAKAVAPSRSPRPTPAPAPSPATRPPPTRQEPAPSPSPGNSSAPPLFL